MGYNFYSIPSIVPSLGVTVTYMQVNSQDYNHQIQVWQPLLGDTLTVFHCLDPLYSLEGPGLASHLSLSKINRE